MTRKSGHFHPFVHCLAKETLSWLNLLTEAASILGSLFQHHLFANSHSKPPTYSNLGHCRPPGHKRELESESSRVGITAILLPLVSYHPCVTSSFGVPFSFPRLLNSLSPCLYSIFPPIDRPLTLLRFWFHNTIAIPSGYRTAFPSYHDSHNSTTSSPSCVGSTSTKVVDPASPLSQWPQADISHTSIV